MSQVNKEASINPESRTEPIEQPAVVDGVHGYGREEDWVAPTDPLVLKHLEWYRDQKVGIFFHFGLYSQIGCVESWLLSDKDKKWSYKDLTWDSPKECQRQYKRLNRSFNPIRLVPEQWARTVRECGMRYIILTTKHHDGFCLWDTAYTQYKTTAPECPFSEHKHANIVKSVFNAFRAEGIPTIAYFSKADWSSPYYWNPEMADDRPTDRQANYDTRLHPELWEKFVDFTHNQVMELVEHYGPLEALWFDGGWVNPRRHEDLHMDALMEKARRVTPGLLVCDRAVGGPNENFLTPECTIPEKPMTVPWESCVVLDEKAGWGYSYERGGRSPREITHMLIEVVAKGGNLAIGVGPQPDGRLPADSMDTLKQLGAWLAIYGDALFETRICAPYQAGAWSFTQKAGTVYAIRCLGESETPEGLDWTIPYTEPVRAIQVVGQEAPVVHNKTATGLRVRLDAERFPKGLPLAVAFRLTRQ